MGKRITIAGWIAATFFTLLIGARAQTPAKSTPYVGKSVVGLPLITGTADNPLTEEKIALGRQLYFDKRLSVDNSVSCATCHDPSKGWSNGEQFATGVRGQKGGRNSPTVLNSGYAANQFWDGRAQHVEGQALGPIANPIEMDLPLDEMAARLNKIEGYRKQFQDVFGTDATPEAVGKAIGAFERTIVSGNAPYDRFKAGDKTALSTEAQLGLKLFEGKAGCTSCHVGPNMTDNAFHNIGIGMKGAKLDEGRYAIMTNKDLKGFIGAFKTPTLREIARTAPYMHDGSMKTLDEVIEHYNGGGIDNPYLSEDIYDLKLTDEEKKALRVFLEEGLASPDYPNVEAPELPE